MKRILITLTLFFSMFVAAFAQAPQKFTYQAVVRDAGSNLAVSQSVGVRISILQGSANGNAVYVETLSATTNANGLLTLQVGGGTVVSGDFATIDWANGPFFLKTETDPNGGTDYTIEGTQQLLSVPYALYADRISDNAGFITNTGCEEVTLCGLYDSLSMLRDTIAQLQATLEALTNPYAESTPMVTTTVVSYITQTSAYCGGIVTSVSNDPVTVRGICWSTAPQPTIADDHSNDGTGVGSFTGLMNGLTPNTTYYARAYATNSYGTAYGMAVSFTTNDVTAVAELPTVITSPVTNIIQNHAVCGGVVTSDGGAPVTARGVCWNTTGNPSVVGTHSTDGSGLGEFTSNMAGLTVNVTYYVCAYATNSAGTAYGEVITFTPGISCPGTPTVTDYDGNTYHTVQIGTQCWMKENMRTTHYSNGDGIMLGNGVLGSTTIGYYYYPNGDVDNKNVYGLLYNWVAAVNGADTSNLVPSGVQGVCPVGWHVPSENEFALFVDYVSENSEYYCGSNQTYIAKALADSVGWRWNSTDSSTYQYNNGVDCFVGNQPAMNNATSFSARPTGWTAPSTSNYASSNGSPAYFSECTYFWTTTSMLHYSLSYENCRSTYGINYKSATVGTPYYLDGQRHYGLSVRCIKD